MSSGAEPGLTQTRPPGLGPLSEAGRRPKTMADAAPDEVSVAAEQPGSAATSSSCEEWSHDPLSEFFIRHKVTKLDTLAGLAVRYNVTVSDIKRANGFLADTAMFAKDTLLIPTRPLPVGPEYSTWAGMIVTHYGRLGPSDDDRTPSEAAAMHFSQTRTVQQLRGYYSTSPSRTQSPQYGSGAEDGDRHHLFAGAGQRGGVPQQVELMERSAPAAAATYIEDRLRRRARGDSQQDDALASSSQGGSLEPSGGGAGSDDGRFALLHHRPALFGGNGAAAVSAGGRQLLQWKDSLLHKLKKVASQPALAVPQGTATSLQQLGQAAVASAPLAPAGSEGLGRAPSMRQQAPSSSGPKAD